MKDCDSAEGFACTDEERNAQVNQLIKIIEGYQLGYIILYLAISIYVYHLIMELREKSKSMTKEEFMRELKQTEAAKIKIYHESISKSTLTDNSVMGWVLTLWTVIIVLIAILGHFTGNERITWCGWYCSTELFCEEMQA